MLRAPHSPPPQPLFGGRMLRAPHSPPPQPLFGGRMLRAPPLPPASAPLRRPDVACPPPPATAVASLLVWSQVLRDPQSVKVWQDWGRMLENELGVLSNGVPGGRRALPPPPPRVTAVPP